ncbi:MAG: DUF424 family protein [Sulfolobaceae archaeon]
MLKIIKSNEHIFINICEKQYLGKKYKKGDIVIDVSKDFYEGEEVSIDYAFSLIDQATIVNIVGNEIIDRAIERGLIYKDSIIKIGDVKFAQIYNL